MQVSYDSYRAFYYVAKYRNITQAARAMLQNQPNVTRTIRNLEGELGCRLFDRSNRGVRLTPEGEKLYAHVSVAFAHLEQAQQELTRDRRIQDGRIFIGASEVALHCILLPVLKSFRSLYPGVRIRVANCTTPQAMEGLQEGRLDLTVVTTPVDLPENTHQTLLALARDVPVCGSAYRHLADRPLPLEEVGKYPLICLGPSTMTYAWYSSFFARHGQLLSADIEAATADQILPMVKHDLGIGFVPEIFLSQPGAEGVYRLRLTPPLPDRWVSVVKRLDKPLTPAAAALEAELLAAARL